MISVGNMSLFKYTIHVTNRTHLVTHLGLTSQKTHRGGLGLSRSVHEEARPCFLILLKHPLNALMLEASTEFTEFTDTSMPSQTMLA